MPVGLVLDSQSALAQARAVAVVAARWTLLETPRAPGARSLGVAVRRSAPSARLWVYAWHYVTHRAEDGLAARSKRTLPGPHGHFIDSEAVTSAWQTTVQLVETSGADGAILRTPPSFGPGGRSRAALRAFVSAASVPLAWEPEGLWEPEDASKLSEQLGIRLIIRGPVGFDPPGSPADWLLVEQNLGPGARDALAEAHLSGRTVLLGGADSAASARRVLRDAAELEG